MAMRIPLVDLAAQYRTLAPELEEAARRVLAGTRYILGPEVEAFEREFAAACGVPHAIGVANGTDALAIALRALGVGPGDEVVTVPNTFIATQEAIAHVGAKPVFADVDPATHTLSPAALERALTLRTRAIVPVHLYGHPADMDPVIELARARSVPVLEDAAQAHGARYRGRPVGALGDAAAFSFYPGKNLGAAGDAGAIVTRDPDLASRMRRLRNHGRTQKYVHEELGWNSRLDELQAALLRVKLPHLPRWNARRRELAARYRERLAGWLPCVAPAEWAEPAYHLFVIEVGERDALLERLRTAGIEAGVHYPVPLHLQPAGRHLGCARGSFPVSERLAERILSLPLYPEMSDELQDAVLDALRIHARP
jgi:dTDP-3-amino-3,4,6-trideoxy-alpha-D-glucose transaminase